MNGRIMLVLGVAGMLLVSGCARRAQAEKERQEKQRRVEGRLDEIQAQIVGMSEQIDSLQTKIAETPPYPQGGVTITDVGPAPKSSKREQLEELGRRSYEDYEPAPRRGSGARHTALAKKHIRVPVPVKEVQLALKNAGCNPGPIDGRVGPRTIAAIRDFQRKNGLKVDGVVGRQTWSKLKASAAGGS